MISEKEAQRLDDWIQEAIEGGAKLLCGGKRDGAMLRSDAARKGRPRLPALSRGSVRPGRDPVEVRPSSTPRSTRSTIASSDSRPASSPATCSRCRRLGPARRRRRRRQRRAVLPGRQHALWRRQGFGPRPRGGPFRDGGHDRDPEPRHPSRRRSGAQADGGMRMRIGLRAAAAAAATICPPRQVPPRSAASAPICVLCGNRPALA